MGAAECPGRARCSPAGNSGRHFPASRNRFLVYSASCTPSCVTEVAPRSSLPADGSRTAERWAPHASLCCHGRGRAQRGARTSHFGFPRLCRRDGGAGTKGPLRRTGRALAWKGRSHGRLLPGGGRGAARVCPGAQWSPAGGFRSRQQSSRSRALPQGPAASAPPSPRPEAPVLALRCPGASGSVRERATTWQKGELQVKNIELSLGGAILNAFAYYSDIYCQKETHIQNSPDNSFVVWADDISKTILRSKSQLSTF